jgi:hypothetical protein
LFFTVLNLMRRPVPGWHSNSSPWVTQRSLFSRVAGTSGIKQIVQLSPNETRISILTVSLRIWFLNFFFGDSNVFVTCSSF